MLSFLLVISALHIPIISFSGDGIGVFDGLFFLLFLFRIINFGQIKEENLLVLFLVFIYLSLVATLFINSRNFSFNTLLIIKQIQYLTIGFVWYSLMSQKLQKNDFINGVFLISIIITFFGMYKIYNQECARLCLVNKDGDSPNPASFILSISILFIFMYGTRLQKLLMVIPILGLMLTLSRTNALAFILTIIFWILIKRNMWSLILLIFIFSLLPIIYSLLPYSYGINIFDIITNPSLILNDPSFQSRLSTFKVIQRDEISEFIFGNGLGYLKVTDSLYTKLMVGVGLLGTLTYLIMITLIANRSINLLIIMIFVTINGFANETTINSFRCMQILIPIIIFLLLESKHGEKDVKNFRRWSQST